MRADPEAVAELGQLRRRELVVLSERLGRVEKPGRQRRWGGGAVTLLSVGLGALLAGIPLLSSRSGWDEWVLPAYWSAVGGVFLLAGVCGLAYRSVGSERADSVAAIKEDLDVLLAAYVRPSSTSTVDELLPHFLQRMRSETRDNQRLIQQARADGRYWKVTETGPSTREWKLNAALLEGDQRFESLAETGRRAASEVERILTARSLRMFRGSQVRRDDRLDDVLDVLDALEELLTSAMAEVTQGSAAGTQL